MMRTALGALMVLPIVARAAPAVPTPAGFAAAAVQSDQYEILAAHTALTASKNVAVHRFAEEMIRDHTQSTAAVEREAEAEHLMPPPVAIGGDQASLLAALQGTGPAMFDKVYAHQQQLAHTAALAVMQDYASKGSDAGMRKLASETVPVIRRHLKEAESLPN